MAFMSPTPNSFSTEAHVCWRPLVLRHMSAGGADGTLIPQWPLTAWCPLLFEMTGSWKAFVTISMMIQPYE